MEGAEPDTATHGFLFADLRGCTAFVDRPAPPRRPPCSPATGRSSAQPSRASTEPRYGPRATASTSPSRPIKADAPRPFNGGEHLGRAVTITVPSEGWTCGSDGAQSVAQLFRLGSLDNSTVGVIIGEPTEVAAVDVDGRTVTVIAYPEGVSSVDDLWPDAARFLQRFDFGSDSQP